MKVFIILGAIFTVVGGALVVFSFLPRGDRVMDEVQGMGSSIAGWSLLPMGLIFLVIGIAFSRISSNRARLLATGIPGQATILSVDDTGVTINDQPMVRFQLRVAALGRPPYDVDHRQIVPRLSVGMVMPGSTLPVRIDPTDPEKLTLDWNGSGVAAMFGARAAPWATAAPNATSVRPNTLSSTGSAIPNTLQAPDDDLNVTPQWSVGPGAGGDVNAVLQQLASMGITLSGGLPNVTVTPSASVDLRPAAAQSLQSTGTLGRAIVRAASATGVVVRGEPLYQVTLDVTPPGGVTYPVSTASLVPPAAVARTVPGTSVPVRIDPANGVNVLVEWMVP
jgi:hypothetical protein